MSKHHKHRRDSSNNENNNNLINGNNNSNNNSNNNRDNNSNQYTNLDSNPLSQMLNGNSGNPLMGLFSSLLLGNNGGGNNMLEGLLSGSGGQNNNMLGGILNGLGGQDNNILSNLLSSFGSQNNNSQNNTNSKSSSTKINKNHKASFNESHDSSEGNYIPNEGDQINPLSDILSGGGGIDLSQISNMLSGIDFSKIDLNNTNINDMLNSISNGEIFESKDVEFKHTDPLYRTNNILENLQGQDAKRLIYILAHLVDEEKLGIINKIVEENSNSVI